MLFAQRRNRQTMHSS